MNKLLDAHRGGQVKQNNAQGRYLMNNRPISGYAVRYLDSMQKQVAEKGHPPYWNYCLF